MFWKREDAIEKSIRQTVTDILTRALGNVESSLGKLREAVDLGEKVKELQGQVVKLEIQQEKKQEEWNRKERELEHKVGLERKRQEFELEAGKREAIVKVREENLEADKKRFEEQMAFQQKRFEEEVGYLKGMMGQVLERLPKVQVTGKLPSRR